MIAWLAWHDKCARVVPQASVPAKTRVDVHTDTVPITDASCDNSLHRLLQRAQGQWLNPNDLNSILKKGAAGQWRLSEKPPSRPPKGASGPHCKNTMASMNSIAKHRCIVQRAVAYHMSPQPSTCHADSTAAWIAMHACMHAPSCCGPNYLLLLNEALWCGKSVPAVSPQLNSHTHMSYAWPCCAV